MRKVALALLMLAVGHGAQALQLGQLSASSSLDQPLSARIVLYGVTAEQASRITAELRPGFAAVDDSPEARLLGEIRTTVTVDDGGAVYLALSSVTPVSVPALAFRVRLTGATGTSIHHYTLALLPVSVPAALPSTVQHHAAPVPALPAPVDGVAPAIADQFGSQYGPVRPGQTLWDIMRERGLGQTGGQISNKTGASTMMTRIVTANPRAFVGADANRLRIGAILQLPAATAALRQQTDRTETAGSAAALPPTVAAADTNEIRSTTLSAPPAGVIEPYSSAQLAALSSKFAALRARYDAQQSATTATPATGPSKLRTAPIALAATPAQRLAVAPPVSPLPMPAPATGGTLRNMLIALAVGVGLAILAGGGLDVVRRVGRVRSAHRTRSADRDLVAEIARKAAKRVQLEGEVKRMIADKRDSDITLATTVIERAVSHTTAVGSLAEIETRIAHGQYNEAEALLEQVIASAPNNFRAKMRLAEIYYLNERHDRFVELAEEIYQRHRADIGDDNWQRMMRMGKVIAPDQPPFSGPLPIPSPRRAL